MGGGHFEGTVTQAHHFHSVDFFKSYEFWISMKNVKNW